MAVTGAAAAVASAAIAGGVGYMNIQEARKARKNAVGVAERQQAAADMAFDEQKKQYEAQNKLREQELAAEDRMNRRSAASRQKARAKGAVGRSDTILTGSQGVQGQGYTKARSILGG
jgi:uncharacterized protein HemX